MSVVYCSCNHYTDIYATPVAFYNVFLGILNHMKISKEIWRYEKKYKLNKTIYLKKMFGKMWKKCMFTAFFTINKEKTQQKVFFQSV